MEHATKIQELLDNDHEREPLRQKAVTVRVYCMCFMTYYVVLLIINVMFISKG